MVVPVLACCGSTRRSPAPDLAREHPPADREDRHGRHDRRHPDDDVRWKHPLGADDERRQGPGSRACARPSPTARGRPHGAACRGCRRGRRPSASCRGPASAHGRRPGANAVTIERSGDQRRQVDLAEDRGSSPPMPPGTAPGDAGPRRLGDRAEARRRPGRRPGLATRRSSPSGCRAAATGGPPGIGVRRADGLVVGSPPASIDDALAGRDDLPPADPLRVRRGPRTSRSIAVERRRLARRRRRTRSASSTGRRGPAGSVIEAAVAVSVGRDAVDRQPQQRSLASSQAGPAAAAVSASVTSPSPSASIRWRSWNVGISAMSMTTSRRISSGASVIPA